MVLMWPTSGADVTNQWYWYNRPMVLMWPTNDTDMTDQWLSQSHHYVWHAHHRETHEIVTCNWHTFLYFATISPSRLNTVHVLNSLSPYASHSGILPVDRDKRWHCVCVCVTLSLTTNEVCLCLLSEGSQCVGRLSRNRFSILWEVASTIGRVEALLCNRKPCSHVKCSPIHTHVLLHAGSCHLLVEQPLELPC